MAEFPLSFKKHSLAQTEIPLICGVEIARRRKFAKMTHFLPSELIANLPLSSLPLPPASLPSKLFNSFAYFGGREGGLKKETLPQFKHGIEKASRGCKHLHCPCQPPFAS